MVKARIDKRIMSYIKEFLDKVSEHYKIENVYLFGSHAKGTQHKDSDIDLAIISKDVNNRIFDMSKMFGYTWDIDANIEPHPYNPKDFYGDDTALTFEIKKNGIRII